MNLSRNFDTVPDVDLMVAATGVFKRYRSGFEAVKGVDFEVRRGECFGLLGPNGAGKSSLMRMISCVSTVTGGSLRVLGMDPAVGGRQIRARLGVVPQDDALDAELSVTENLIVHGRYFGIGKPVIRQRAQARHVLWERLYRLKNRGVTILLTTHYMDEAEQLCDRLVVMDRGVIVAHGTPRRLIEAHTAPEVLELRFRLGELGNARAALARHGETTGHRVEELPDRFLVYTDDADKELARLAALRPLFTLARRSTLEDVFLALTGRTLTD